jgi:hypothetical protein
MFINSLGLGIIVPLTWRAPFPPAAGAAAAAAAHSGSRVAFGGC